jgi:hypothetical protein
MSKKGQKDTISATTQWQPIKAVNWGKTGLTPSAAGTTDTPV